MKRIIVMIFCWLMVAVQMRAEEFVEGALMYEVNADGTSVTVVYNNDKEPEGELVIPSTVKGYNVTAIGEYAFQACEGLTSVEIPEGVTSIGDYAFSECSGLTGELKLPKGLESIGDCAFYLCEGLTSVNIPSSLKSIGAEAFSQCSGLTGELVLPEGFKSIGNGAFWQCKFTSVTIPASLTSIGEFAFSQCFLLKSVTSLLMEPLELTKGVFSSVDLNNATLYVPVEAKAAYEAADWWSNFGKIEGVIAIGDGWKIDGEGVLTVWKDFEYSSNLNYPWYGKLEDIKKVVIEEGVTKIGEWAFNGCKGLTSVELPEGLTKIGKEAFSVCTGLENVEIPASVTSIGGYAFEGCSQLESIVVAEGNEVYDSRDNCNAIIETETNTLIAGCKGSTIPSSVTSIGNGAFAGCGGLTGELVLPDGLESIGDGAFAGCGGLTGVKIPGSVTSIGNSAFYECSGLTGELVLPEGLTSIGDQAFKDCRKLESVKILEGVTSISPKLFTNCSGLKSVTIPDGVKYIMPYAFERCNGLESVTSLSTTPPMIPLGNAFYDVDLSKVTLYVPAEAVDAYKAADEWSDFGKIEAIQESVATGVPEVVKTDDGAWYDISGRRYDRKPSRRGVYVHGGKKVILIRN